MGTKKEGKDEPKAKVCHDCASWKVFGHKCYFYWEHKKECSQHRTSQAKQPTYKEDPEHRDWKKVVNHQSL